MVENVSNSKNSPPEPAPLKGSPGEVPLINEPGKFEQAAKGLTTSVRAPEQTGTPPDPSKILSELTGKDSQAVSKHGFYDNFCKPIWNNFYNWCCCPFMNFWQLFFNPFFSPRPPYLRQQNKSTEQEQQQQTSIK